MSEVCPFVSRPAKRLRIFVGEAQVEQGRPLYRGIVEELYRHGIRGATVFRGIEGFGPEHHLSTERIPDIAENLPIIIEAVDSEENLRAVLPSLDPSFNVTQSRSLQLRWCFLW